MGLGVDMPRTPAVFPAKTKWSLKEQLEWAGASEAARRFKGAFRQNYESAVGFADQVEAVLERQVLSGQILALEEADARQRYGDRLAVASLSALKKGDDDEGNIEARVLHDGTNGVKVNKFILVLDSGISPTAQDEKACRRLQAAMGVPHCGLTADVEGAHRVIFVRPEDWPLQACQVSPGGKIHLNMVGTFGV